MLSRLRLVLLLLMSSMVVPFGGGVPVTARAGFHRVSLPADARAHRDAQTEWWYFTGHLRTQGGHTYGFEVTTFRLSGLRALLPATPTDTAYRIDLALTDEGARTFSQAIEYLFPAPGRVGASDRRLRITMPGRTAAVDVQTLTGGRASYHLRARLRSSVLDLTVQSARPPLLEGGKGVVPMGVGGSSYYYSLTNMRTTGTFIMRGRAVRVTGITWMDHQWGTWNWRTIRGWDWMAIQLDNGISIALANFVQGHGRAAKGASISFPDGRQLVSSDASMEPIGGVWRSPTTHTAFPAAWRVRVPQIGLDAIVMPTVADQEMYDRAISGSSYFEGSGRLVGTLRGRAVKGLTYTELAGYGKRGIVGI